MFETIATAIIIVCVFSAYTCLAGAQWVQYKIDTIGRK